MVQKFFVNFWIWWYLINIGNLRKSLLRIWLYWLGYMNVVPMVRNIFVPIYQDTSIAGRSISLIIRINWIFFGSISQAIVTIPIVFLFFIALILPFLPIIMILTYFLP